MSTEVQGLQRGLALLAGGALLLLIGIGGAALWLRPAPESLGPTLPAGVAIGGPFSLIDETGAPVTEKTYRGRHMLIFFGFTYCPDVCPTELAKIAATLDLLGQDAQRLVPLFVSIDPERDTPEALARYTDLFHPAIIGLTGTEAEVAAAARAFRVYYNKVKTGPEPDAYTMDHSAFVYLMGPDGGFRQFFSPQATPEQMAAAIRSHLARS
ncbi:SCO family protein [Elioraea tepida]|uniref:SCO family protein n=1 Tax=Elioraea tepida TaxID=2843330 RepID=A0A975U428_9PROT|nr:SCO family protein [Elioraea tepida]QXM25905.1 SCO family protein [Elioraea tepida]